MEAIIRTLQQLLGDGHVDETGMQAAVAEISPEIGKFGLRIDSLPIPFRHAVHDKAMSLIPLAELATLFRHLDYSVNGRPTWAIAGDHAVVDALMAA